MLADSNLQPSLPPVVIITAGFRFSNVSTSLFMGKVTMLAKKNTYLLFSYSSNKYASYAIDRQAKDISCVNQY